MYTHVLPQQPEGQLQNRTNPYHRRKANCTKYTYARLKKGDIKNIKQIEQQIF
jgi:hypothetical protein